MRGEDTSLGSLRVIEPGALTTVQDLGRPGWAHLGVPRAGALDRPAAALANRLVGNPESAAVLETTMTGFSFSVERAVLLAVTGAGCELRVGDRAAPTAEPVSAPAGATVRIGPALAGVRSYLAVAGGIAVPPVLGSRSTDTLAWIGPPAVRRGDLLPLGPGGGAQVVGVDAPGSQRPADRVLRLYPGPRADWVTDLSALHGRRLRVGEASNRVGVRLEGAPLPRAQQRELASEGIVLGAVQLPPSGDPVVFLNDHPTTGGYPVIAVVHPDDLPVCAQVRPGEELTLRLL